MLCDDFGDFFLFKTHPNFAHRLLFIQNLAKVTPPPHFVLSFCELLYAEIEVFLGGVYSKLLVVRETKEVLFGGVIKSTITSVSQNNITILKH